MKHSFFAAVAVTLLLTGCYRDDLWNMHQEIESLKNETIASLTDQAHNMESSITNLNELNATIQEFITVLEASGEKIAQNLSETQGMIDGFKKDFEGSIDANVADFLTRLDALNDAVMAEVGTMTALMSSLGDDGDAIQKKVDLLEAYLELFAEMDWAEGTFATLSVQDDVIAELTSIKERINALNEASENLDAFLRNTVDSAFADFRAGFSDELNVASNEVIGSYSSALSELSASLKQANTEAVAKAIEANEQSVMSWVNEKLKDYYKVEAANAQYELFDLILGTLPEGKASFQSELDDLSKDIDDARKAVSEAYEDAIKEAIEKHNATITADIDKKIQDLRTEQLTPLSNSLVPLTADIRQLQQDAITLDSQIGSTEQQKARISSTIAVLTKYKDSLKEYVESVKADLVKNDKDNYDALLKLIDALDALIKGSSQESLPSQIAALEKYIGTLPDGATDAATWISATLTTINEQFSTIKLTTEVNGIFSALKASLGDRDASIKNLEKGLDRLLVENEAKIKGWITDTLKAYSKAGAIEGSLDALEAEIKSYFEKGDKEIQTRIDSLKDALAAQKTKLAADYEKAISDAIEEQKGIVNGRITSDFKQVDSTITALGTKAGSVKHVVDSLRADLSKYMLSVDSLKNRMGALETYLAAKKTEDASYSSLADVVSDLTAKIDALGGTFADKKEFDKLYDYIKDTLSVEADKVSGLVKRLEDVDGKLDVITNFVADFDTTGTSLYNQVSSIRTSVDSLKKYVYGVDAEGIKSYQSQIDDIMKALYGDAMDPDNAASGSIVATLDSLSAIIAANHVTSITYVPRNLDQTETLNTYKNSSTVDADFRFIVRPASLAGYVSEHITMKYKPISGGASTLAPYSTSVTVEGDVINVHVTAAKSDIMSGDDPDVCSALFYSCEDDSGNVLSSFTSKFIFFSVNEDEATGDIPVDGGTRFHFPAAGGTFTIKVGTEDMTVEKYKAYWLVQELEEVDEDSGNYSERIAKWAYNNIIVSPTNRDNRNNGLFPPDWVSVSPGPNYSYHYQVQLSALELDEILKAYYPFFDCYEGVQEITVTVEENKTGAPRNGKLVFRQVFTNTTEFAASATGEQDLIIYIEQDA